jgi:hypothetical protein
MMAAEERRKQFPSFALPSINPFSDVADEIGVHPSLVTKWYQMKDKIKSEVKTGKQKLRIAKERYRFHDVDEAVMRDFRELRGKLCRVGIRWLIRTYRRYLIEKYPHYAACFRGSNSWRTRFYKRHNLALRKRTNVKKYSAEEALERLKRFCAGIQKLCASTLEERKGWDPHYGCFPRALRSSLDQVCY